MQEPQLSFHHAALKIQWANHHINQLTDIINTFIKSKPYTISCEANPDGASYGFKFGLHRDVDPMIALMTGDIVFNLRSCIDFCWMGLIRDGLGKTAEKKTAPITNNRKGLVSTVAKIPIKTDQWQSTAVGILSDMGFHSDFADGGNQSLIALNDLSNFNKHNMISTTLGVTELRDIRLSSDDGAHLAIGRLTVKNNIVNVARISGQHVELQHDGEPTVDVVFGAHKLVSGNPVIPTLVQFSQFSTETLNAFCAAFPSEHNPILV